MSKSFVSSSPLPEFALWKKMRDKRKLLSFSTEITARCNNDCRHCYINLPAGDRDAIKKELSLSEIKKIADEAASMGAVWCLVTGGEPLIRKDFFDIYLYLRKKGLLVSVFTNACLIDKGHIEFFKKYPPRDIEVTVYGVTEKTYEQVTRTPGSYSKFMRGLEMLLENGIKVRFKAMALRSNAHELPRIAEFCEQRTKDYFRFDPLLHLRFDRNEKRNRDIISERLSPEEIAALEQNDPKRMEALRKNCDKLINSMFSQVKSNRLFYCGAGKGSFIMSYDGLFRLCSSLWHPDCVYDLKNGSLSYAWNNLIGKAHDMRSNRREFLEKCRACPLINLCMWCPAHAYLETGDMDGWVDYFCKVAHERAGILQKL